MPRATGCGEHRDTESNGCRGQHPYHDTVNVDLNLLIALDALLQEGSVGGAADRLSLSQPAMSRTLARIRRTTGDQILVRSGRGMVPTPYAEEVRAHVRALVEQGQSVLSPGREVDPAALERTFTLRCHDAVIDAAGPAITAAVRASAPGVRLRFLAEAAGDTDDLRSGRVDLEVHAWSQGTTRPGLRSEAVGTGTLVVAVRADHPIKTLTPETYAAADHIVVSRRGRLRDQVDDLLAARALERRVVVCVPTSAAAFRLVAQSDLLAAVPSVLAGDAASAAGLRTLPMPLDITPATVAMSWHSRFDADGAHSWLRGTVRHAMAATGISQP